ncbi:MAG: tetratricopeptide repeat protein [Crocinitomicaceae bacterium]
MIGHYDSAVDLFKKCLQINPQSAASQFALAQIYKNQDDTEKAIEYCRNAFRIDENNKWYAEFLASTFFKIGDYNNSAKFYKLVVEKHGDRNIDNLSKLAQSYIFSNQKSEAIATLDQMELELGPTPMTSLTKHDLYQELGKTKQSEEALQNLFAENPTSTRVALEAMDYFLQTRQYNNAEIAIKKVFAIESENVFAKLGSAEVALARAKIDDAFTLLSESLPSSEIEIDRKTSILESLMSMGFDNRYPEAESINSKLLILMKKLSPIHIESAKFLSLYGRFLMQNEQEDSAIFYFQRAVDIEPNSFDAWMNLMDAGYNSGDYLKVIDDASQVLTFYPNQPMIYLLKGISEYELLHFAKAEETLFTGQSLVIDDNELSAEFRYHLAKSKWKQNEKEKAKSIFQDLFEVYPSNARFVNGFAQLLYFDNEKNKAFQYAKKAANLDPRIAEYSAFYAKLLVEEKNYELAQKMIEQAIISDIGSAEYMETLGDILFFQNKPIKAVEAWKEAYNMKPSSRLEVKIKTKNYHE